MAGWSCLLVMVRIFGTGYHSEDLLKVIYWALHLTGWLLWSSYKEMHRAQYVVTTNGYFMPLLVTAQLIQCYQPLYFSLDCQPTQLLVLWDVNDGGCRWFQIRQRTRHHQRLVQARGHWVMLGKCWQCLHDITLLQQLYWVSDWVSG